ncbi:MAG: antitoxin VbhA family protein [Bacillota bacterium]|nr:antitoxin VbhA family protein [Bacillota bacterium]
MENRALNNTKTKTKRVIESVGASLAFENLKPSKHAQEVGKQYLEDKISSREAVAKVKKMHASRFGK